MCSPELFAFGEQLGMELSASDRVFVCGGMGGFMEAVCKGLKRSPETFFGQTVGILPGASKVDANQFIDIAIPTGIGIARNTVIINTVDVLIAAGGGAGTLSEIAFAWQQNKKVLCVTTFGGWAAELASQNLDDRTKDLLIAVQGLEEIRLYLRDHFSAKG